MESLLLNCMPVDKNTREFNYFDENNKAPADTLFIGGTYLSSLCFLDRELVTILASKNIGKYNITYKNFDFYIPEKDVFDKWNVDLQLNAKPINDYLLEYSDSHWHREEYGLVILSSLFIAPPKLVNIVKLFTLNVWLGLIISILAVTAYALVKDKFYDEKYGAFSLTKVWNKLFMICRNLLNQGPKNRNECFVVNFWSLLSVIFIVCFSGNILTILITHDVQPVNSFEQLLDSKLKIIIANKSYVYFGIRYAQEWNDERFLKLQSMLNMTKRIEWLPNIWSKEADAAIEKIAKKNKAVIIGDSLNVNLKRLMNFNEPLGIGEQKYNFQYMGFPMNKNGTHRHRIYKIIREISEHGINDRQNMLVFMLHEFRGRRKPRSPGVGSENTYSTGDTVQINTVNLKLVQELFMLILMCYAVSIVLFFTEKVFK